MLALFMNLPAKLKHFDNTNYWETSETFSPNSEHSFYDSTEENEEFYGKHDSSNDSHISNISAAVNILKVADRHYDGGGRNQITMENLKSALGIAEMHKAYNRGSEDQIKSSNKELLDSLLNTD